MKGFADIHPLAPISTVQGAMAVIHELALWLVTLTGMRIRDVAQGRCPWRTLRRTRIRAALEARGDAREVILVPESAHGTNPATAAFAGYRVESIPARDGRVDPEALMARIGPRTWRG